MLSDDEIRQFRDEGFLVLHALFTLEEAATLRAEVDAALAAAFEGAYGRNTRDDVLGEDEIAAEGNFIPLLTPEAPFSMRLVADDGRLLQIADQLLGTAVPVSPALATCMVSDMAWHTDGGIGDTWLRFNAYLDSVSADSGALQVQSGSHRGDAAGNTVVLSTEPGDVIAFNPRVTHGAFGSGDRKRLRWCVDFAGVPGNADTERRSRIRELIRELSDWPHPNGWPVWSAWASDASDSKRTEVINRLTALGAHLVD